LGEGNVEKQQYSEQKTKAGLRRSAIFLSSLRSQLDTNKKDFEMLRRKT
jgi:hypothetical protein